MRNEIRETERSNDALLADVRALCNDAEEVAIELKVILADNFFKLTTSELSSKRHTIELFYKRLEKVRDHLSKRRIG